MKPYEPWEYCRSIDCKNIEAVNCRLCPVCHFHAYLSANNQILEPGSELARLVEALVKKKQISAEWWKSDAVKLHQKAVGDIGKQIDEILTRLEE